MARAMGAAAARRARELFAPEIVMAAMKVVCGTGTAPLPSTS